MREKIRNFSSDPIFLERSSDPRIVLVMYVCEWLDVEMQLKF
jgi:hypothetical protein